MNNLLSPQPTLIQELNVYLEKGNQMYIDPGIDKKFSDFMMKIKAEHSEYMPAILQILEKWKKSRENNLQETSDT